MAQLLDVRGLNCPLPLMRTRKALQTLPAGEVLEVQATDPMAAQEIPAFCKTGGYLLEKLEEKDGVFLFIIRQPG